MEHTNVSRLSSSICYLLVVNNLQNQLGFCGHALNEKNMRKVNSNEYLILNLHRPFKFFFISNLLYHYWGHWQGPKGHSDSRKWLNIFSTDALWGVLFPSTSFSVPPNVMAKINLFFKSSVISYKFYQFMSLYCIFGKK